MSTKENLNLKQAIEILNADLTSTHAVEFEMIFQSKKRKFKIKNYIMSMQKKRKDLLLVEIEDVAFTVSTFNPNYTVAEQIVKTLTPQY